MSWMRDVFGVSKAVIGMIHLPPLPGTPLYDEAGGVDAIREHVHQDLVALQEGGIDAVMFCNENDRPYVIDAGHETVATMSATIAAIQSEIRVPFGVDVLWDAKAALAIAKAVGGTFVREVLSGVYGSDFGLWNTAPGEVLRYRRNIGATDIRMLFNINAEFAAPLAPRPIETVAQGTVFATLADAICVSGPMTGVSAGLDELNKVRGAIPETPLFANTGTTEHNIADVLRVVDGAVVGTGLKMDGVTWNPVDPERVKRYMSEVRRSREAAA